MILFNSNIHLLKDKNTVLLGEGMGDLPRPLTSRAWLHPFQEVLSSAQRLSLRAAIILLSKAEIKTTAIAHFLNCSIVTVLRTFHRFHERAELNDAPRCGRPAMYGESDRLRVVTFYCQTHPLPEGGRWTFRWAASYLKAHPEHVEVTPSKSTLHRILKNNSLKPHQSRYFLHITDPEFFPKMEHLVALYKSPPPYLFFFDECPGIQVLKRLVPDQQSETMKKRLEEFEYIRNGTMDVFAFLEHATGHIYAECLPDHKTLTFLDVFQRHVTTYPSEAKLHYVMDNLSTHRSYDFCAEVAKLSGIDCPPAKELKSMKSRMEWLTSNKKRIVIHFTPYHGSWLNLIEIWFGIMGKKVLSESYSSPESFKSGFEAFVDTWNELLAHPFHWSYEGHGLHEIAVKRFTKMLQTSSSIIETRILTKCFGLMTNLLNNYSEKISNEVWLSFSESFQLNLATIKATISNEKGPQKKKKAQQALANLLDTMSARLAQGYSLAA